MRMLNLKGAALPIWLTWLAAICISAPAAAASFDARTQIAKANELIQQGRFAFARVWLNPALIAPSLSADERSGAYYMRGFSFQADGFHVSAAQDYARAVEFNPRNPAALKALGYLHLIGKGVRLDQALAFAFFQQAADLGHPEGQLRVGVAYLTGAGVAGDLEAARIWLQRAAEQGQGAAMTHLAASYRSAYTDNPDPEQARQWYGRATTAGEIDALVALGFMARNGEGRAPSAELAADYFKQAAAAGSADGMVNLAYAHLSGQGTRQDFAAARSWFTKAAQLGAVGSYVGLGHIFEAGLGVQPDMDKAAQWYRQGAERGLPQPTQRLAGLLLAQGDEAAASKWLAQLPDADAEAILQGNL